MLVTNFKSKKLSEKLTLVCACMAIVMLAIMLVQAIVFRLWMADGGMWLGIEMLVVALAAVGGGYLPLVLEPLEDRERKQAKIRA